MARDFEPLNLSLHEEESEESDSEDEEKRTIYCTNFNDRVTDGILYELFLQAGPIVTVSMPKDKDGRQRGFAFITYAYACSVPYALNLFRGIKLYNRELVSRCRKRDTGGKPRNDNISPLTHKPNERRALLQTPRNFNDRNDFMMMQPRNNHRNNERKRRNSRSPPQSRNPFDTPRDFESNGNGNEHKSRRMNRNDSGNNKWPGRKFSFRDNDHKHDERDRWTRGRDDRRKWI